MKKQRRKSPRKAKPQRGGAALAGRRGAPSSRSRAPATTGFLAIIDRQHLTRLAARVRTEVLGGDDAHRLGLMLLPVAAISLLLGLQLAWRAPLAASADAVLHRWSIALAEPRRNRAIERAPIVTTALRLATNREMLAALPPAPKVPREAPAIPPLFPISITLPPAPLAPRLATDREILAMLPPPAPPPAVPRIPPLAPVTRDICLAPAEFTLTRARVAHVQPLPADDGTSLGLRLARAALAQTTETVIYNARYSRIAYPMGDVPALYGVCTDVVIRAYRALGIDLQQRVHLSKGGRGDTSIDHRRTETLRAFFARFGHSLPITPAPEDYLPGDIVTYYRPQNRAAKSHIAIVSDVMAPSGRPMVVHNRGWGPQLEDALFVDQITGHYRYDGGGVVSVASAVGPRVTVTRVAARPVQVK